mgnify:CR=1 FL=1
MAARQALQQFEVQLLGLIKCTPAVCLHSLHANDRFTRQPAISEGVNECVYRKHVACTQCTLAICFGSLHLLRESRNQRY